MGFGFRVINYLAFAFRAVGFQLSGFQVGVGNTDFLREHERMKKKMGTGTFPPKLGYRNIDPNILQSLL